jgi:hypothetical protein
MVGANGMSRAAQLAGHPGWRQVVLTGLVLALLAARVPLYWNTGEFVAEDGWVFFADAWNQPFPGSLLLPYAGYFHVLPRLLAELCTLLPVATQPQAYAALGLTLNAVILGAFYLPVFRMVLPSDTTRLGIVLLLALAPNAQNLGLLLGLHWYLAFGLCLVLIVPTPTGPGRRLALGLVVLLCAWSSPSTLVLLPFALLGAWRSRDRADRLKFGFTGGALLVVAVLILWLRLGHAERTGAFQWTGLAAAFDRLVLRGWIGVGLLGPRLAGILAAKFPLSLELFSLAVLVPLAALLWKNRTRDFVRPVALLLGAGLLMLLLSLTRTAYVAELATLALPVHTRYLTAPTLLLYAALGILGAHALSRAQLAAGFAVFAGLLVFSLPGQNHWSRSVTLFRLRDALPAIRQLELQAGPASLYVPADIPYWGPVLEKDGGVVIPSGTGLASAIGARREPDGQAVSWLGRFTTETGGTWVNHETLGRLEFTGLERGRVFFRDPAGRLLFTSPLLYPRFWQLTGLQQWTLLDATPPAKAR